MSKIIDDIRKELFKNSDEKTRISGERFFKEPVKLYGLKSAATVTIAKEHFAKIKGKPKTEIFTLCEELWQSGFLEEAGIACIWSYNVRKEYVPGDIILFERWISKYVTNWATCDTFCNHTVGTLIEMYPGEISSLKKWAKMLYLFKLSKVHRIPSPSGDQTDRMNPLNGTLSSLEPIPFNMVRRTTHSN